MKRNRSREYYRAVRAKSIERKWKIAHDYWYVKAPGVLSKGKIHCSCYLCSEKSKYIGRPVSEQRRSLSMNEELQYAEIID